ncbi:MAG TPA: hypothetical protein VE263_16635 [Candidatus Angelobacter sp.]|nr:hypothetical protein [Candidatus Angelobacter sp.]
MRLPARLRWSMPFGQKIELCESLDVSRGGLRLSTKEPHDAGVPLWVTFPHDVTALDGQPEVLAHVVRCGEILETIRAENLRENLQTESASERERSAKLGQLARPIGICDAPATFAVAIRFETEPHPAGNGNRPRHEPERRGGTRRLLAVPVRVRPEHVPWFEEAMTLDFSPRGMRFRGHREYAMGDLLKIALQDAATSPWVGAGEFRAAVVRVSPAPDVISLDISVSRV